MTDVNQFRVRADGEIERVGDWGALVTFTPLLLAHGVPEGVIRTTIKVRVSNGWALYRVTGITSNGELIAKRLRRGRDA